MSEPSAISLIPPVVVIALAIWLRRPILSLVVGAVVGLLLVSPSEVIGNFSEVSLKVMQDETIGWLILVCGSFGSLIALLVHTGGALAFGRASLKLAKGPRSSLLMTFGLGVAIFIDDYLNALTVGESMKRVTDRFKISREKLAYIVDSTAAPICVIIPLSTWAVFFGGLLESNDLADAGNGIDVYMDAIPYMLYPWFATLLVFLVAMRWMPDLGPMRKAEMLAKHGSAGAMHVGSVQPEHNFAMKSFEDEFAHSDKEGGKLYNFLLPIFMLIGFTIYFDIDIWMGLLTTLALTVPFYLIQRVMTLGEVLDNMVDGFKTMLPAIGTVIAAFILKDVCDQLGLSEYVVGSLKPYMTASMLPAVVFVAMALLAFATGSSWGIFAVTIPIVMPLAAALDANIPLTIGALLSASAFGSQACFYSDSTVLAAQGSGCDLMSHAITQLPYCLIAAAFAFTGFVIMG